MATPACANQQTTKRTFISQQEKGWPWLFPLTSMSAQRRLKQPHNKHIPVYCQLSSAGSGRLNSVLGIQRCMSWIIGSDASSLLTIEHIPSRFNGLLISLPLRAFFLGGGCIFQSVCVKTTGLIDLIGSLLNTAIKWDCQHFHLSKWYNLITTADIEQAVNRHISNPESRFTRVQTVQHNGHNFGTI